MKNIFIAMLLICSSCGKFKVDAKVKDSSHKVKVDAETYSYVIVRLDFIKEIKELCTDIYPEYENPEKDVRNKLISQCTLDKMSIVDFKAISEFKDGICDAPETEQEIEICKILTNNPSENLP